MKSYLECWSKYAVFSGRSSRKEYWMWVLFYVIFGFVASIIDLLLGLCVDPVFAAFNLVYGIFALTAFLPSLAVTSRRLHDIGKSGWLMLISLIPIIGIIVLLVFLCKKGDAGENRFGPEAVTL